MHEKQERRLVGLNVTQTILTILICGGTCMGVFAGYVSLPQKVHDFQEEQQKMWARIGSMDTNRVADHDILVRLDEQMKAVRQSQEEMRQDVKALRRP